MKNEDSFTESENNSDKTLLHFKEPYKIEDLTTNNIKNIIEHIYISYYELYKINWRVKKLK